MDLRAQDIQFVIGAEGKPTAVLVDIAFWEHILDILEDAEDAALVKETLTLINTAGGNPASAGFIDWQTAREKLEQMDDTQE